MSEREREQHGHLPYAWSNWKQLDQYVQNFFALAQVQRALSDEKYRIGDWQNESAGVYGESFGVAMHVLRRDLNQTQKLLAEQFSTTGVREVSNHLSTIGLLCEGSGTRTEYQLLDTLLISPAQQRVKECVMYAAVAVRSRLYTTCGKLQDQDDVLVGETHGLHILVEPTDHRLAGSIRQTNFMATQDQLRTGYGYGATLRQLPDQQRSQKIEKRILGAKIRGLALHQLAIENFPEAPPYCLNAERTTLLAEVCTQGALDQKDTPKFFAGQWGIGPKTATPIIFSAGGIRRQIITALPVIAEAILHYPPDAPLVEKLQ